MSTSPVSIAKHDYSHDHPMENALLTREEFLDFLPAIASFDKKTTDPSHPIVAGSSDDPIMQLFLQLNLTDDWWKKFSFVDPTQNYTRNLVATDNTNYTLILMCWNSGHESPIHNHPCKGCWVRVVQGSIQEHRYIESSSNPSTGSTVEGDDGTRLILASEGTLHEGQSTFIKDSQGYHKLGNPSHDEVTITLHLYCPPYKTCTFWWEVDGKAQQGGFPLYSEFGRKLE